MMLSLIVALQILSILSRIQLSVSDNYFYCSTKETEFLLIKKKILTRDNLRRTVIF